MEASVAYVPEEFDDRLGRPWWKKVSLLKKLPTVTDQLLGC